jgi:phytoene dehydrogenase-like protein
MLAKEFDAAIIGDSIDALVCGALLAQHKVKTLIIGENSPVGGYCRPIKSRDLLYPLCVYNWDISGGVMELVLKELNLLDKIKFQKIDPLDRLIFPEHQIDRPADFGRYIDKLKSIFSDESAALDFYCEEATQLSKEWLAFLTDQSNNALFKHKKILKYYKTDYKDFLDNNFKNEKLKGILSANIPFSRITFTGMAGYLISQIFNTCYIEDGVSHLIETLYEYYLQNGGSFYKQGKLEEIILDENQVTGCRLNDDIIVNLKCVITTSSIEKAFSYTNIKQPYQAAKRENKSSVFSVILKLKNKHNLNFGWCCYIYPGYDVFSLYEQIESGEVTDQFPVRIFTDPNDEYTLRIEMDVSYSRFSGKEVEPELLNVNLAELSLKQLEYHFPGTIENIDYKETITPLQVENASNIRQGINNAWALSVSETMKNPLLKPTTINGLYSTGNWGCAWFSSAKTVSNLILATIWHE